MIELLLAEGGLVTVGWAGALLLAVGLVFVVILTIANARLKVKRDPTAEAVEAVLPGVNCGGCGLAGCGAYAEAVVKDHGLMGKCGPGGEATVHAIAEILGIEAAATAPIRAVVHCSAKADDKIDITRYEGLHSCTESQVVAGVQGCPWGCLGFGDCVAACDFGAIEIVEGQTVVNYGKCVGCGACVKACPRQLIQMVTMHEDPLLVIACASGDKAKEVRGYCKVGCVGCGLCAKMSPEVFKMQDNLAVINYEQYGRAEQRNKAVEKCPRSLMVYVGKNVETPAPAETEPLKVES